MWLSCSGCRCVTTTNARPESDGSASKKDRSAGSPPAEAPIPTTVNAFGLLIGSTGAFASGSGSCFRVFFAGLVGDFCEFLLFLDAIVLRMVTSFSQK